MKLIADAWRDFEIDVIPLNAPEVQRVESRRAFYAGAVSMWSGLMSILEPGEEPTEKDLATMDAIKAEIDAYVKELQSGKA